jgi:Mg2+-importing ATPase
MTGDEPFWAAPPAQRLGELGSSPAGLDAAEAARRLARYGSNDARAIARPAWWRQLLGRFLNPLVLILLLASGLSAATGELGSFVTIVVIVLGSVLLDFTQELQATRAVDALRRSVALQARVLRAGEAVVGPAASLVPGDVIRLRAGDLVPADCLLLEAQDLFINQALLTGEPYPAEKHATPPAAAAAGPVEAANALFMGTSVVSGSADALVCRTGHATHLAHLAGKLASRPATEFEIGTRRFGLLILRITVLLVLFVIAVNVLFHRPWLETLMFALALAVGLTPELLPMVVTVTLARGAVRLARRGVIVKQLTAIHHLGAMDVLCTDKTGTLTEARIRLVQHVDAGGRESERVLQLAFLNSHFGTGLKSPLDDAILERAAGDVGGWRKIAELPFDFERRRVSVLLAGDTERLLVVKGAPEDVLRLSSSVELGPGRTQALQADERERQLARFRTLGGEGFRVLGVAYRTVGPDRTSLGADAERDLVFVGFTVFVDPPKPSAARAIAELARNGIQIVVLTGDNELVTRHLCKEVGLDAGAVVTGEELAAMPEEALLGRLAAVRVFCRVQPQDKHRVILALKRTGRAVGFLGDGINDAPALHAADVGISVKGAADVAHEAAAVILVNRQLSVIAEAVREGRRAVINVAKYILMGSSSNFGNMLSMAGAALFLPFLPMLPPQVLLNNLLYDASEIGVPFDRVDPELAARPVRWDIGLIERFMLVMGPVSSAFDALTFVVLLLLFGADESLFHTGWFIESLATQVLVIFAIRTRKSMFASRPHPLLAMLALAAVALGIAIPLSPLGPPLGFVTPPFSFFVFLAVATASYLVLVELIKPVFYDRLGLGHGGPPASPRGALRVPARSSEPVAAPGAPTAGM